MQAKRARSGPITIDADQGFAAIDFAVVCAMSALPLKADIHHRDRDIRFVAEVADMSNLLA